MTPTTFEEAELVVLGAASYKDIFSDDADYRAFAKILHPDAVDEAMKDRATKAFNRLGALRDAKDGKRVSLPRTIATRKRTYILADEERADGDIAKLYDVTFAETASVGVRRAIMKMPKSPRDSDLMEREAKSLKLMKAEIDPKYHAFFPELIETFRHRDTTSRETRRVNVVNEFSGFYSLAQVREVYSHGVDPKDAAWMWRRLLVAIGQAYDAGIVHGAVVPEHVLIHPGDHGLTLVDWCYSCRDGEIVPSIVPVRREWYPQSVFDKEPPTHALDAAMAAKTMVWLCGPKAPREFRAFANGCSVSSVPKPAELLGEFDELLERLWGRRRFRHFSMPD